MARELDVSYLWSTTRTLRRKDLAASIAETYLQFTFTKVTHASDPDLDSSVTAEMNVLSLTKSPPLCHPNTLPYTRYFSLYEFAAASAVGIAHVLRPSTPNGPL